MTERLYAVKVGPDWVELRLAPRPPKPIRSAVKLETVRKVYDPSLPWNYADGGPYRKEPYTYQLRVLAHEGGERLCILPLQKLRRLCVDLRVKMEWRQGLARLPKPLIEKALDPTWRRQNAKP
jgi:hypothetical protein